MSDLWIWLEQTKNSSIIDVAKHLEFSIGIDSDGNGNGNAVDGNNSTIQAQFKMQDALLYMYSWVLFVAWLAGLYGIQAIQMLFSTELTVPYSTRMAIIIIIIIWVEHQQKRSINI